MAAKKRIAGPAKKGKARQRTSVAPAGMPGPEKRTGKGVPPPRYTTHKRRAVWFRERATWPFREADIESLQLGRAKIVVPEAPAEAEAQWECVGPTNVGGRCTAIVCHPSKPDIVWIGSAGGGVWKSEDGGQTWRPLWHKQESLNVGALAIDPKDPNILYCGTGEANLSADSYPGVGVYRSSDGGETWELWAPADQMGLPRRIGVIAIDPFDSNHVRLGGVRHSERHPCGMFFTRDGGLTWQRESFVSAQPHFCHSIAFHPKRRGVIFAAMGERGFRNGIWRTEDSGTTWTQLTKGLPDPPSMGRASLAIARSRPSTVYAQVANQQDGVLGVFVSQDRGNSWQNVAGRHFSTEVQMTYGNTIAVHPRDHRHVICGGVDLHLSTDGGASWRRVTQWNARLGASRYAHADHHALLMPAAVPGRVYSANDGGMDLSNDGGLTWTNRSQGLAATMYYDLDVAATDARCFGGGTQDNGTQVTRSGSPDDHSQILGGDGGWMVYDPTNARRVFASYYNFNIYRFDDGRYRDVSPPAAEDEQAIWMCFITVDPNRPATFFTGSLAVWRTLNSGEDWTRVSPVLDGSFISAIEVAPANSQFVYVGTENGGIFRSTDGGRTWSMNIAGAVLPGRAITRIETHPADAKTLYVTAAATGTSHVFRSTDAGVTWEDVDRGKLPDVPHHAAVVPPDDPRTVYVANDAGVFASGDGGGMWRNLTRNLPNVMVVDLVHQEQEGALYAATYGRSIWRLRLR